MTPTSRRQWVKGAMALFLAAGLVSLVTFNAAKPRIMIVHSLSQGSSWTAPVDQGMRAALAANRIPVWVTRDYLNLDLLSAGADRAALASGLRRRIDSIQPHALILVDDEANELIGRHYAQFPSGMSIIYTGLLGDPRHYGYGDPSVVIGVREALPLDAISQVIGLTHKARPLRIAIVGAATLTGLAEMQQVQAHTWAPHEIVASESVPHFKAWKRFVEGPARSADVLIALTMDNLAHDESKPTSVPEEEVARWTEKHAVPLAIGIRPSYVQFGGALAVSAPPKEYGKVAVELALKRVANPQFTPPGGHLTLDSYNLSMRLSALERRSVSLPPIYREAARASGNLYR